MTALPRGRWAQVLGGAPGLEAEPDEPVARESGAGLEARVEALEREVAGLKQTLESFRRQFE